MSENDPPQLGVHRIVIRDFCGKCDKVQECKTVKHVSGTETLCCACGHQVDFDIDEDFDDEYSEPVGSCENCGTWFPAWGFEEAAMAMDVTNQWPMCSGCKQPMMWADPYFVCNCNVPRGSTRPFEGSYIKYVMGGQ